MVDFIYEHYSYYVREAVRFWHNMGPYEYAGILIFVGLIGWLMMRGRSLR